MNEHMQIQMPEFMENMTAEKHIGTIPFPNHTFIETLDEEIYCLKRLFERNSPIIRIQAAYRAYRVRLKYKNYIKQVRWSIRKVQKVWRGYKLRKKMKTELRDLMNLNNTPYLMMTNEEMKEYYASRLLKKYIKRFTKTTKRKKVVTVKAGVVQKYFRYYIAKESLKVFKIDDYPWFYCLKEQREMLEGFI